jgi:acetolactate synthase-1/2/3 large subunit
MDPTARATALARAACDAGKCISANRAVASSSLPEDAIVANGAGNFATRLHRHFIYKRYRTQLGPTKRLHGLRIRLRSRRRSPSRSVPCSPGLATRVPDDRPESQPQCNTMPVIAMVVNNGMYGTIRMHQERSYPGVSGTG